MNRKHLRKVTESLGLQLVSYENGEGNSAVVVLRAPDRYEQKFHVNRLDDQNGDRINEAQMRRFAKAHSMSKTLPGIDEIDMQLSNVQRAFIAAHEKVPDKAVRTVQRVLEGQPLLNPEGVIRNAMASDPDAPIPGWVGNPPAVEDPIQDAVESIDKVLDSPEVAAFEAAVEPYQPPQEPEMPSVKLAAIRAEKLAHPEPATPEKPKRQSAKVGQINFFKICQVLSVLDMTGLSTQPKLQAVLQEKVGFPVPLSTVGEALEATGKTLDKPVVVPKHVASTERILAKELLRLLAKLGEEPSAEVRAIAGVEA